MTRRRGWRCWWLDRCRLDDLGLWRGLRILLVSRRRRRRGRRSLGGGIGLKSHDAPIGDDLRDALLEEAAVLDVDEVSLPVVSRLDDDELASGREERAE